MNRFQIMIKKLRVTVDGKTYEVMVETTDDGGAPAAAPIAPVAAAASAPAPAPAPAPVAATAPPPAPTPPPAAPTSSGPGSVKSPLAGRIAAIAVTIGQEVKENDHLITVEAMKMNTFVFAPKSGKVAEINVAAGDAVSEGQILARVD